MAYRDKDKKNAQQKQWREEHKEQYNAYMKAYYHKNIIANRKRRWLQKIEVLSHYSLQEFPACAFCGETDIRILQIDHIAGGGAQQRRKLGISSGTGFYAWLRTRGYPKGYQVLCANCNLKKEYEEQGFYAGEM